MVIDAPPKPSPNRKPPRPTCTDHCCGCNRHFHGLTAFDLHRQAGGCTSPLEVLIRSKGGQTRPGLQLWTAEGYCDKLPLCWDNGKRLHYEHPVELWQAAVTDEQRDRLAALRRDGGSCIVTGDAADFDRRLT